MLRTLRVAGPGAVAGTVAGWVLAATIGGNLMTSFTFAGGRGYEATGPIGAIVGAVAGALLALLMLSRRSSTGSAGASRSTPTIAR